MSVDLKLYSGYVVFRNETYAFAFSDDELHLIPPEERKDACIDTFFLNSLRSNEDAVNEDYIEGECYETNSRIVFLPVKNSLVDSINSSLIIKIFAYILFNHRPAEFSRIAFSCPEINHIHPITQAIRHESIMEDDVVFSVRTMPNEKTCTERQLFHIDGHDVYAYFGMIQTASAKVDRPPLSITASLYFDFEPTLDYGFAYRLWQTAYHFIRFLCYRNNISLPVATLHSLYKDDLYPKCAELRVVANKEETETYPLETDRCIKQAFIAGSEGKILSDIAQNMICLRHIPETYKAGKHFNEARYVLITAAFEWEFQRLYPDGITKSDESRAAEAAVTKALTQLKEEAGGKQRKIYKRLLKLVESSSIASDIVQVGEDFPFMAELFGNRMYELNGAVLDYAEMGKRLSSQRNHFAHADMDKPFDEDSIMDLAYVEWIVYAVQLRYYEVSDRNIQQAINSLFHLNRLMLGE